MWGIALGISIFFVFPENSTLARQQPVIRVLVKDSTKFRFRADGSIPLLVRGIGYREKKLKFLKLKINNGQLFWSSDPLNDRWNILPFNKNIIITSSDYRGIWLGKRRYRGQLRVGLRKKSLIAVNHLGIERYLMSVVGSEMPKAWPKAALKAQAVAARTYALKKLNGQDKFDIDSSESSQVYLGIESETDSTRYAVNSTRSLVLRHKGKLISAVFHSSSGGQTESSGSVWKYQLPYLISVPDFDQNSPKYRWEMKFTPLEMKKIFYEIGGVKNIRVLEKSYTGRILLSKVYGPKGNLIMSGRDLRNRMKLKSTKANFKLYLYDDTDNIRINYSSAINSPNFPPDLPSIPKNYYLSVKGYGHGHGVGMSQWGAHAMAKKGSNFLQILRHYYKGVNINAY